jgi:hypothetical protein
LIANSEIALRRRVALLGGFVHLIKGLPGTMVRLHQLAGRAYTNLFGPGSLAPPWSLRPQSKLRVKRPKFKPGFGL